MSTLIIKVSKATIQKCNQNQNKVNNDRTMSAEILKQKKFQMKEFLFVYSILHECSQYKSAIASAAMRM